MIDFDTFTKKMPKNVGDLGKLIVAKGFKKLPKVQKITQSGHTEPFKHPSDFTATFWHSHLFIFWLLNGKKIPWLLTGCVLLIKMTEELLPFSHVDEIISLSHPQARTQLHHTVVDFFYSLYLHLSILPSINTWRTLVEGDEDSYLPNRQSNLVIALYALSLLFCNFINTTAYHWADTSLHIPLAVGLPGVPFFARLCLRCCIALFQSPSFWTSERGSLTLE